MIGYDAREVIGNYIDVLARDAKLPIRDVSELPYPKDVIKAALRAEFEGLANERMRDNFRHVYVLLANFQPMTDEEVKSATLYNHGRGSADGKDLNSAQGLARLHIELGDSFLPVLGGVLNRVREETAQNKSELELFPKSQVTDAAGRPRSVIERLFGYRTA